MRVYLAGKMAGLTLEEMNGWRDTARCALNCRYSNHSLGRLPEIFETLNPVDAGIDEDMTDREIVANNKAMIRASNLILAEFDHEEPSFGTVCEVIYADGLGIPVISWGRYPIRSPWIREHITKHFETLAGATDYLNRSWNF